ncbi:hypothetical protein COX93_01610 [Candidatus Nomurabacteria bacterium CG_4_10_14_0_2_um_filter_30_12]|uniref:PsbP C-terminal domain-containing protein n=3 Tax=Candidatus Nomuraibacteriota TaxID=1752729 RepID=A0A1J4UZZ9_9BACT|nr:MAG: hypothetical protein AUJ22_01675 [Candidatus Nomurabacteria bacterium CG1_02_31_12]PIR68884.1 MAG: hypothetical protein COU48_01620 [Candidatus Nomurabacteria bacterium CG10_big_fil_rev_8_21_14_0_10_03_31_7]PIZ87271.1 MAG: hypothetical protein COX93_01610 [Candidatus Nomurabacteria bacterium CG_4_10_14_0_2_um_filter_30_12]
MKNNKGFIGLGFILVIIAVLVVGGGAYYLGTKNSDVSKNTEENLPVENQNNVVGSGALEVPAGPFLDESNYVPPPSLKKDDINTVIETTKTLNTLDWKTYKNIEYNFEIKYPSTITPEVKISNQGKPTQVTTISMGQMLIVVPSYFRDMTIDQILEGKSVSSTVKNIQVDGKKAVSVSDKESKYTYVVTYILKPDNKNVYMTISYNIWSLPDNIYNNMYQQMFDTLKFIF